MGLDFSIYAKNHEGEDIELAYGRKSWELVYALVPDYDEYGYNSEGRWVDPPVTLERWDSLMKKLEKIGPKLDEIYDAYRGLNNWPDDWVDRENMTPKMRELFDKQCDLCFEYEMWYNQNFDTAPTLGYDFSVFYMKTFYEADKEVRKYLNDPNWEVYAVVSY
jgi:hypothetical protein